MSAIFLYMINVSDNLFVKVIIFYKLNLHILWN